MEYLDGIALMTNELVEERHQGSGLARYLIRRTTLLCTSARSGPLDKEKYNVIDNLGAPRDLNFLYSNLNCLCQL
jgi:hypothetical protein